MCSDFKDSDHERLSYQSIVLWNEQGSEISYKCRSGFFASTVHITSPKVGRFCIAHEGDNASEESPESSTEIYPVFARIGSRKNPENLNQGYMKRTVYATHSRTFNNLKENITSEINGIDNALLQRTARNMERRVQLCLDADGRHFQHLM
ncbi:hypothetical protein ANN_22099 [Periplaneta americana]|uniref:Uncharacterized protein n=1 Tax=Periplaneta americana TaxID=6978 RepID=A0ABQ8S7D1_PERAM|nr:hypothetical protein ANN_22099 [Periplaneta americana]